MNDRVIQAIREVHEQFKARGNWGHSGRPGKVGGSIPKGSKIVGGSVRPLVGGQNQLQADFEAARNRSSSMNNFGIQSRTVTLANGTEAKSITGRIGAQLRQMNRAEFIQSMGSSKASLKRNYSRIESQLGQPMSDSQERAFREYFIGLITHDEATNRIGVPPTDD